MTKISFGNYFPKNWFWQTLYAVRLPSKPGWHLAFIATTLDHALGVLKSKHRKAAELRLLDSRNYTVHSPGEESIRSASSTEPRPNYLDWSAHILEPEKEHAPIAIMEKHPDAIEYRIIEQEPVREDLFNEDFGKWDLVHYDWYYEPSIENWLAPGEPCPRPKKDLLPAVLAIECEPPKFGWWDLHLTFSPPTPTAKAVWAKAGETQEKIQSVIMCSDVYCPLDSIKRFVSRIKSGLFARAEIDEEGPYVYMKAWPLDDGAVHLHIESKKHHNDYCKDFLLERAQFIAVFERVVEEFYAAGGWDEDLDDDDEDPE